MKPPCLDSHFAVNEKMAFSLAVVSNATLVFFIVNKTSTELRTYSRVLLCNCIVDATFSAASFLIQLHGDMRHGMFAMVIEGVFVGDLQRNLALVCGYMVALYSTIIYAAVPMAFRYMVVCREYTLSKKDFTLLILLVLFLASLAPVMLCYTWWPSSLVTTRKYAEIIANSSCQDAGEIYVAPLSEMLGPNTLVFVVVASVVSSGYAVIVFCAFKLSRKAKSVNNWSASARDAHKQIHSALLFQAATPLMLDVIPISMCSVAIVCGFEQFHFIIPFLTSCLAWIPVVNPLSAILFIKCYRTTVRKFIDKRACDLIVCLGWKGARPYVTSHTAVSPLPSTNRT